MTPGGVEPRSYGMKLRRAAATPWRRQPAGFSEAEGGGIEPPRVFQPRLFSGQLPSPAIGLTFRGVGRFVVPFKAEDGGHDPQTREGPTRLAPGAGPAGRFILQQPPERPRWDLNPRVSRDDGFAVRPIRPGSGTRLCGNVEVNQLRRQGLNLKPPA